MHMETNTHLRSLIVERCADWIWGLDVHQSFPFNLGKQAVFLSHFHIYI